MKLKLPFEEAFRLEIPVKNLKNNSIASCDRIDG